MAIYEVDGKRPVIHPSAFVHPDAVVIGNVSIGADSSLWPGAVVRGDFGAITIGTGTSVQDGAVIHVRAGDPTQIGDGVIIGHNAHLEGCTIGNGTLIGSGSILLPGAVVGRYVLVGAGAVIPPKTTVPDLARALGVPAKIELNAMKEGFSDSNAKTYTDAIELYRSMRRLD
ncbi:putative acetyltransferase EpsM [mine drainage metagenome]|uniref:Putative acetyltransferase EpsM n=1 Tax=mine drainage metagenome TaxID=410659 RepID=A0A1J5PV97_9ZZZZ